MPRPPKPPMTLKEAKKAYKKEGIGIQYTASQMARADRFDEREAKRKKELEREKQRVDNKRKRDQKEARERAVKQKMLEEGRITVEDTWGKVTASQPRLNKFFGQNAVAASKKNTKDVTTDHKEKNRNMQGDDQPAQGETKTTGHTPGADTTIVRNVLQVKSPSGISCPSVLEKENSSSNTSLSKSHLCNTASEESNSLRHVPNPSSALSELKHAQLNVPSAGSRKLVYDTKPWKVYNPTRTASETEARKPEIRTYTPNEVHDNDGPSVETYFGSKNIEYDPNLHSSVNATALEYQGSDENLSRTTNEVDEEEDFSDGIDDETLLELYDDQYQQATTPRGASADLCSPTSTVTLSSPSCGPEVGQPCTDKEEKPKVLPKSQSNLSDSFTSCFNEIDEDDLIALAEEVEAEISTPLASADKTAENGCFPQVPKHSLGLEKQMSHGTPSPPQLARPEPPLPPRSQPTETKPSSSKPGVVTPLENDSRHKTNTPNPKREPLQGKGIMAPPPAPAHPRIREGKKNSRDDNNNTTTSSVSFQRPESVARTAVSKQRTKRVLPWNKPSKQHYYTNHDNPSDDFDLLGPSTQALMVELAEQAEAQISSCSEGMSGKGSRTR
ncbi:hypothetical protein PV08_10366 [Exophiala spinifera]|uniref:Uncharacterized protein n=1 Tax=Exophiala spinifera TaxID=91928 RepID=A0A0D1ZDL4_9EURO|nr:uncharacterized protein PV08_10366 [Exophiala spinifera]KIW11067.1 hypothetical protein PV08_10366 [Exophiala spinifera]